jgi:nitroreductase
MTDQELWHDAVALAINAPSVRNVQPWRFRLCDDGLELRIAPDAHRVAGDAAMRTVAISCGVVLHHLRVALRAAGMTPLVELPGEADPEVLAVVRLGEPEPPTAADLRHAAAIPSRHTQRTPFDERPLRGELLDRLAVAGADEGGFLEVLTGDRRAAALGLVDPDDRALADQAPALAILSTGGDGLRDQLEAGQALSAILLEAAGEGCWVGYLDTPLRDATARARLRSLATRGEVPMLLVRIGHGVPAPHAPRLPVRDVLEIVTSPSIPSRGART